MRKILLFVVVALLATSCYNTRVLVGNINTSQELRRVGSRWNGHLIGGLISLENARVHSQDWVHGYPDYMIKTNTNFWNLLVSGVTFGIYTPTQTTFYVPDGADPQAIVSDSVAYNQPHAEQPQNIGNPVAANQQTAVNAPGGVNNYAVQSNAVPGQTKVSGAPKYSRYFNVAYSKQKIKFDDADSWLKNDYGVSLTRGRTYYVAEPVKDLLRVGIDWTVFDLNFSGYSYEYPVSLYDEEKENIYQGEVGMEVGPSLTVTPVSGLMVNGYVRYAPSFSCYYSDSDDFHCNYGSFFVAGAAVAWRTISLGVEGRWGRTKLEIEDEDYTLKTAGTRLYLSFRF